MLRKALSSLAVLFCVAALFLGARELLFGPQGHINITRADYEGALSKWKAAGVTEYEITVESGLNGLDTIGSWALRVTEGGEKIDITNHYRDGTPTPALETPSNEVLSTMTVEGLFATVDDILRNGPYRDDRVGCPVALDYTVTFDPKFGYPSEIRRVGRELNNCRSSWVYHVGMDRFVDRFKVIK